MASVSSYWCLHWSDALTFDGTRLVQPHRSSKNAIGIDDNRKLQTDYIDLMLLHQPYCDRYGAYRDLEKAYTAGKVRAIGVSNFFPDHLIDLASNMEIAPMVNQMETHVFNQQHETRKFMEDRKSVGRERVC